MNICVVGAGPGAMAMAACMRQSGHSVGILELASFQNNLAYVCGVWDFQRIIKDCGLTSTIDMVECSLLPFACRKTRPDTVSVHGIKRRFMVSTMGGTQSGIAEQLLAKLFGGIAVNRHLFEAGLHETNFVIHACIALMNFGFVQGKTLWTFYRNWCLCTHLPGNSVSRRH